MKLLIIPKPILNSQMEVMSYCFRFQKADKYLSDHSIWQMDGVMSSPCLEVLEMVGLSGISNGLPIFVPLNKMTLLADIENQCVEPPDKIIFLLNEETPPEEPFLGGIKRLRALGYRFAVENISDTEAMFPIIKLCDYVFINAGDLRQMELLRDYRRLSFIASGVHDRVLFDNLRYSGLRLFEGSFYSIPVFQQHNVIAPIKVNRIQLLNIVRNEDFDIDQVVRVVGQDPSLSVSLMRFVNSPYLGISQKIKTLQHAVAMLGQIEVRRWVTTATSGILADDKPNEITKLSLMRAKLAENLARHFEMAIHEQSLFLMGLFSILDVVLEMPMDKALKIVVVTDRIYDALVYMQGEFADVLNFIYVYEAADWNEVYRLMILYHLDVEDVFNAYIDAARWYGSIVNATEDSLDG